MKPLYFAILTAQGEKKLARAAANQTTLKLTEMAVGDGNDTLPSPERKQTRLVNEQRRAPINTLFVDPLNPHQLIAEQIIPEDEGGWWIREIGLFDEDGELCAIANCPPTYKPKLAEGSGRTQIIRLVLAVTSTDVVELNIDPSIVLATRQYVDQARQEATDHLAQALKIVKKNFAPISSPALTGTPTAPTPEPDNDSEQLATTAFVQAVGHRYITHEQGDIRYWKREDKLFPDLQMGYQVLPSGLILQWGFVEKPTFKGVKVTYPIAFPRAVFSVYATNSGPPGSGVHSFNVVVNGREDFQLYCDFYGDPPAIDGFWLALGY